MKTKVRPIVWLTESAVMIALATVLSFIKLLDLPYGGSITIGSMLPMIVIAYRYGIGRGMITGLVYSVIQLLCGIGTLEYATSFTAAVAIIMLDYIIAFAVTGLGGLFRDKFKNDQTAELISGAVLVCLLRYICHVISGCTVWAGVSIPSSDGLIYSLSYNATYMIPETVIVVVLLWYLSGIVDFRSENLRPTVRKKTKSPAALVLGSIGWLAAVGAVIYDTVAVFGVLQNPDSGEFDFSLIGSAPWCVIGIVTGICAVICAVLLIISHNCSKAEK